MVVRVAADTRLALLPETDVVDAEGAGEGEVGPLHEGRKRSRSASASRLKREERNDCDARRALGRPARAAERASAPVRDPARERERGERTFEIAKLMLMLIGSSLTRRCPISVSALGPMAPAVICQVGARLTAQVIAPSPGSYSKPASERGERVSAHTRCERGEGRRRTKGRVAAALVGRRVGERDDARALLVSAGGLRRSKSTPARLGALERERERDVHGAGEQVLDGARVVVDREEGRLVLPGVAGVHRRELRASGTVARSARRARRRRAERNRDAPGSTATLSRSCANRLAALQTRERASQHSSSSRTGAGRRTGDVDLGRAAADVDARALYAKRGGQGRRGEVVERERVAQGGPRARKCTPTDAVQEAASASSAPARAKLMREGDARRRASRRSP